LHELDIINRVEEALTKFRLKKRMTQGMHGGNRKSFVMNDQLMQLIIKKNNESRKQMVIQD
jgi:hypothetical protein